MDLHIDCRLILQGEIGKILLPLKKDSSPSVVYSDALPQGQSPPRPLGPSLVYPRAHDDHTR